MSAFQELLAIAILDAPGSSATSRSAHHEAAAVLAAPELVAIRGALLRLAPCAWHSEMRGEPGSKLARNRSAMALEALDVPKSVIDWVLGGAA